MYTAVQWRYSGEGANRVSALPQQILPPSSPSPLLESSIINDHDCGPSFIKFSQRRKIPKYNMDYIRLLGLMQTITGEQCNCPLLANKDRRTSIRKTNMDYGQTKYSQALQKLLTT